MLSYLHVKNLALIHEAEVEFGPGLNILTGETGAGKSILMGSVNLALGQKVPKNIIRNPEEPALVELIFSVNNSKCIEKLKEKDIFTEDGQIIISRKITENRSICRINGEVCTAACVREIAGYLLDIHGQHTHQSLLYQDQQLEILDKYGKEDILHKKEQVRKTYKKWLELKNEWKEYQMDEESRKREISFLEFEISEIQEASLVQGEDLQLEEQYQRISNSKDILETLAAVERYIGLENGAGDEVGRAIGELGRIENMDKRIPVIQEMLGDIENLLQDVERDIQDYAQEMSFSQEEFYELSERLNLMNHLKSKYGDSVEAILNSQEEKQKQLDKLIDYEQHKIRLQEQMKKIEKKLEDDCLQLSLERQKWGKELSDRITEGLVDLNFLHVAFSIEFSKTSSYTSNGNDKIEFVISTNPGEPLRPLAKVASGGELSRIMLAIKTILADKDETETLIFDEIDTGISGRTAQKVSEKMEVIGHNHQILCITHLPQIAAMADHHYLIEKNVEEQGTITRINPLDEKESIAELARILGGAVITEHTVEAAKEMKELAQIQKNTSVKS